MTVTHAADQIWTVRGLDEFSAPGWFPVRADMPTAERAEWVRQAESALATVVGVERWDGAPTSPDDVRELLGRAFEEVQLMDAAATFQVWPVLGPVAVMCRVMLLTSDSVPRWERRDGAALQVIESKHLGVGLQFTPRTRVESEDGATDIQAIDLIFDDGTAAIVLTVEPTFGPVLANVLPGLQTLMDTIWVERPGGSVFAGVVPDGMTEDSWEVETS
ncbi:hypothetical protein ABTX24_24740 [Nocardioides sp. NPDC127514]|uniref:hypothetical protein n=1 Tax=unclassified Nocardioides TaxID=2615069 RepID=UPI003324ED0F